jgi:hypothetical protein
VLQALVAALICVVPAAGTLAWATWALGDSGENQTAAVLGGTGLRLFAVVGVGMALFFAVPTFAGVAFFVWLVFFYLVTLTFEVVLLVRRLGAADRPHGR